MSAAVDLGATHRPLMNVGRCVRIPVIRQTGASDCGLVALEMVLQYHGTGYERHELRRAFGNTAGGTTLDAILTVARQCGLDAEGFDVPVGALDCLPAPAILHWRHGHFVVFEGVSGGRISIVNPVGGRMLMRPDELAPLYSGYALVLEPGHRHSTTRTPATSPGESEWHSARSVLAPWIHQERSRIISLGAHALGTGAAASVGVWGVGNALTAGFETGVMRAAPAIAVAILSLGAAAGLSVRAAGLEAHLTRLLGAFLTQRFARMTAGVSHEYLTSRTSRFLEYLAGDLDPTVNTRMPSLCGLRLLALAVITAAALFGLSMMIGLAVFGFLMVIVLGAEWRTRRWSNRATRWRGSVQTAREWVRAVLARPSELRAAGALLSALKRWRHLQERAQAEVGRASIAPPEPHVGLLGVAFIVIGLLTGGAATNGHLGYGAAMGALLLGTTAVVATHAASGEIQRLRGWLVTLANLADAYRELPASGPQAEPVHGSAGATLQCRSLRHAAMGRGLSPTNLDVWPGEAVAVLGDAGARAAFAHLALGLVHPLDGTLTIDGIQAAHIEDKRRGSVVAGVLADAEPLAASILDNFRLVDPACDRVAVFDACSRVGLAEWVVALPLGELTPLSRGMLAGAAPRLVCLARLLLRLPRVLVLDGTLDELDAHQAQTIADSLNALPCTVVLCTGRPEIVPPAYRTVWLSSTSAPEVGSCEYP